MGQSAACLGRTLRQCTRPRSTARHRPSADGISRRCRVSLEALLAQVPQPNRLRRLSKRYSCMRGMQQRHSSTSSLEPWRCRHGACRAGHVSQDVLQPVRCISCDPWRALSSARSADTHADADTAVVAAAHRASCSLSCLWDLLDLGWVWGHFGVACNSTKVENVNALTLVVG